MFLKIKRKIALILCLLQVYLIHLQENKNLCITKIEIGDTCGSKAVKFILFMFFMYVHIFMNVYVCTWYVNSNLLIICTIFISYILLSCYKKFAECEIKYKLYSILCYRIMFFLYVKLICCLYIYCFFFY